MGEVKTVEVVEENNQLVKLVEESGIEKSKGQVLLEKFSNFFALAAEWESKAKSIVITRVDQKAEMKMAKQGRLFLKSKRVEVENTRKMLKENLLREGKAIDGIANVLKSLIEPLEDHLEAQEKFAERLEQERKNTLRSERLALLFPLNVDPNMYSDLGEMEQATWDNVYETAKLNFERVKDAEKKAEADKIAKEAEEAKERERIRLENEKLKADAVKAKQETDRIAKEKEDAKKARTIKAKEFLLAIGFQADLNGVKAINYPHFIGTNHYSEFDTDKEMESFILEIKQKNNTEKQLKEIKDKAKAVQDENDRLAKIEKDKADKLLADERAKAKKKADALAEKNRIEQEKKDADARKAKADVEEKLRQARAEADKLQADLKAKADKEEKERKAKALVEKKAKTAPDKEKLKALATSLLSVQLPSMASEDGDDVVEEVKNQIDSTVKFIENCIERI